MLVTHTDVDHIAGVAALAEGTGSEVWAPAGEVEALRTGETRGGLRVGAHDPAHTVTGGDEVTIGGHHVRGARRARATRSATSRSSSKTSSSRVTCCSRVPSGGSISKAATGTRCSTRCGRCSTGSTPTPSSIRGTARRRRWGGSCRRTRSCASCAQRSRELEVPGSARDARRPAEATQRGGMSSGRSRRSRRATAGAASRRPGSRTPGCSRAPRVRPPTSCTRRCTRSPTAATGHSRCGPRARRRSRARTSSTACTASRNP